MGTAFSKVATLDSSASFWSHTMAVQMPDFSIHIMPERFCHQNANLGQKNIVTYMCKMYGHTFAAYDVTQQIIIKGIHDKMKIL